MRRRLSPGQAGRALSQRAIDTPCAANERITKRGRNCPQKGRAEFSHYSLVEIEIVRLLNDIVVGFADRDPGFLPFSKAGAPAIKKGNCKRILGSEWRCARYRKKKKMRNAFARISLAVNHAHGPRFPPLCLALRFLPTPQVRVADDRPRFQVFNSHRRRCGRCHQGRQ